MPTTNQPHKLPDPKTERIAFLQSLLTILGPAATVRDAMAFLTKNREQQETSK